MPLAKLVIPCPVDFEMLVATSKVNRLLLVVDEKEGKKVATLSGKPEDVVFAARRLKRPATDIELLPD